jgi:hypothetical protein
MFASNPHLMTLPLFMHSELQDTIEKCYAASGMNLTPAIASTAFEPAQGSVRKNALDDLR